MTAEADCKNHAASWSSFLRALLSARQASKYAIGSPIDVIISTGNWRDLLNEDEGKAKRKKR